MRNFWEGYRVFKKYHTTALNLMVHFLTSVLQIFFVICFTHTLNLLWVVLVFIIPYITDGIGHIFEGNFKKVLSVSKEKKRSNSAGVSGFDNFLYRIIAFCQKVIS